MKNNLRNLGIFRETSQEEEEVRNQSQIKSSGLFALKAPPVMYRRVGCVVKHDLFTSEYLRVPHPPIHPAALLYMRDIVHSLSIAHAYLFIWASAL